MRHAIQLGISVLTLSAALAQSKPDVAEILKNVSETYKGASQYELVMHRTETDPKTGEQKIFHFRTALKAPDRYRMEGAFPDSTGRGPIKGMDIVLDGARIWFYDPDLNEYSSYPASAIGHEIPDELEPSGIDFFTMARFREAADHAGESSLLREEELEAGGRKIMCYVLYVARRGGHDTWWVDKSYRVVREDGDGASTVYTTIKIGEPLSEKLFKFEPPSGAKRNVRSPN